MIIVVSLIKISVSHSLTWIHDWTEKQMNVFFFIIVGVQATVVGSLDISIVSLQFYIHPNKIFLQKMKYFQNRILKIQRMEQIWERDHSPATLSIRELKKNCFQLLHKHIIISSTA